MRRILPVVMVLVAGCARQPAIEAQRSLGPATESPKTAEAAPRAEAKPRPEPMAEAFDPLQARAHLPLSTRMVDLQFVSVKELDKGWMPGYMAEGKYLLAFAPQGVTWRHADVASDFVLEWKDDGSFVAKPAWDEKGDPIAGRVDVEKRQVHWDGQAYEYVPISRYDEMNQAARHIAPPPDETPSTLTVDGYKITLDPKSPRPQSAGFAFGLGSVKVVALGHVDAHAIVAVTLEVEGGYSTDLYRIPGTSPPVHFELAEIRLKCSLPDAEHKHIESGNLLIGSRLGQQFWRQGTIALKDYVIWYSDLVAGDGKAAEAGDQVEVRLWFYDDREGNSLTQRAHQRRPATEQGATYRFTVGAGGEDQALLDAAVQQLKAGGWRRVGSREECAGTLRAALPNLAPEEPILMDVQLVAIDDD